MEDFLISENQSKLSALIKLIESLRGENGCPWDKKQTPQSMTAYLVEEVYELMEAIESGNIEDICEELGDVLFQTLFIARLYEEAGHFNIETVAGKNRQKMIRRHPHVFGDKKVETSDEVRRQWRDIKQKEHYDSSIQDSPNQSALDSVPRKLPALMRAYRISERAAGKGFDWDDVQGVMLKAEEEWSEFKFEIKEYTGLDEKSDQKKDRIALELGDMFFTLVNVARFIRIHPETALSDATKKFETRFRHVEKILAENGEGLDTVSRDELERLWQVSKKDLGKDVGKDTG